MGFMNEFLEQNWGAMTTFLQSAANPEGSGHMATYDGYVDLALELATLHLLLCDIFSSLDQVPLSVCPQQDLATSFSPHTELVTTVPWMSPALLSPSCPCLTLTGHPAGAGAPSHHPRGHQGRDPCPRVRPAQLHRGAKVPAGGWGHTWDQGGRVGPGDTALGLVLVGLVLALVGTRGTPVQIKFGVTGPTWVQGMVLVPDGLNEWVWFRWGMGLVPVHGMVLVQVGFRGWFWSQPGLEDGSGPS